jgi:cephalosporin hydroxylase
MNFEQLAKLAGQTRILPPFPDKRFPPSLYYRFFQLLAQVVHPRLSVELGVSGGGGSLHLALGWGDGRVVGVDQVRDHAENIAFIERICQNFVFWQGDSVGCAADVSRQFGKVDILFIDTIHTRERTLEELAAWSPYLSDKAIICLDDLFRPDMYGLWEELPEPKARFDFLHDGAESGGGFGVLWNES